MYRLTRRELVRRLALGLITAPLALGACASSGKASRTEAVEEPAEVGDQPQSDGQASSGDELADEEAAGDEQQASQESPATPEENGDQLDCEQTTGLSDAQNQVRESLQYTDQTPKPEQRCDNCSLYVEPKSAGTCGGCKVVPGPIHPAGWCTAWVPIS
ncbi:MAG: high-potential iron-sulfur protein [Persicimonas sp.]